jgi:hypothetical protein
MRIENKRLFSGGADRDRRLAPVIIRRDRTEPHICSRTRDVPLLQVMCDGDAPDVTVSMSGGFGVPGRRYRRPDSDAPNDRYRLYELAGVAHFGTRYPPYSNTSLWQGQRTAGRVPLDSMMNSLPHNELFMMSLSHLVNWVVNGTSPPRAPRIEINPDGRYFAKDEHGNSRGGIRCVQMDVPRATYYTYYSCPRNEDGSTGIGTVGTGVPFDAAKMARLYRTAANYVAEFDRRLDALIAEGWFMPEHADGMRAEARAQSW